MKEDGRKFQIGQRIIVTRPVEFTVQEVYFSEDAETGTRNNFQYRLSEDVVVSEGEVQGVTDGLQ